MKKTIAVMLSVIIFTLPITAKATQPCDVKNKACLMNELKFNAQQIEDKSWRDKIYRELAKSYVYESMIDPAITLIEKIETPDTKAMTIRGIGMAAADLKWEDKAKYDELFTRLKTEAEKIKHPPSYAIAYTYIAMAQAFSGDDDGAMKTALSMKNDALKHKALAESAEIQAERGDYTAAIKSIQAIDSMAFKNKAYAIVAKIFTKRGELEYAYLTSTQIENPYKRAQSLQDIINYDNDEENTQLKNQFKKDP